MDCLRGYLSQKRLVKHLHEHGYVQDVNVPCLFRHYQRGTIFTLVVDDFAVKYKNDEDADHLINILNKLYVIKVDKAASKYLGFNIQFDDTKHTVTLSMPDYIPKVLARFCPNETIKGARSPAIYVPPDYGKADQIADDDTSQVLEKKEIRWELLELSIVQC